MKTSIITVSLNSEKSIERTIKSVLDQTAEGIEYIIKDGGSSDRTIAIAESYLSAFKRKGYELKIISEPDTGIYDAMNQGIDRAGGDIIGIINSDDWYEKEAVSCMEKLFRDTGCDLAFANIRMHMRNGSSFIKKARVRPYTTSRDWNHPTQFVKREVYDKFRYRCRDISDDMDFYFRVKKAGYKVVAVDRVLANFQMGGVSNRIPLHEVLPRIKRRYRIYRENGYSPFYIFECVGFEVLKFLLV